MSACYSERGMEKWSADSLRSFLLLFLSMDLSASFRATFYDSSQVVGNAGVITRGIWETLTPVSGLEDDQETNGRSRQHRRNGCPPRGRPRAIDGGNAGNGGVARAFVANAMEVSNLLLPVQRSAHSTGQNLLVDEAPALAAPAFDEATSERLRSSKRNIQSGPRCRYQAGPRQWLSADRIRAGGTRGLRPPGR